LLLSLIVKRHSNTLEFQSTFTGSIGQGLDASVILETTAVKSHCVDTGGLGALGDEFTYAAAASALLVLPPRKLLSRVEALANTVSPAGAITWA
jgi:hypothetical protein